MYQTCQLGASGAKLEQQEGAYPEGVPCCPRAHGHLPASGLTGEGSVGGWVDLQNPPPGPILPIFLGYIGETREPLRREGIHSFRSISLPGTVPLLEAITASSS